MKATMLDGKPVIFNVGYQGNTIELFIGKLKDNAIDLLVDLRERPSSRIPGFSRNKLEEALKKAGIDYKWAGKCLGGFTCTKDKWKVGCEYLAELAKKQTVVIMCMEWDYQNCHREKLAEILASEFDCHNGNI